MSLLFTSLTLTDISDVDKLDNLIKTGDYKEALSIVINRDVYDIGNIKRKLFLELALLNYSQATATCDFLIKEETKNESLKSIDLRNLYYIAHTVYDFFSVSDVSEYYLRLANKSCPDRIDSTGFFKLYADQGAFQKLEKSVQNLVMKTGNNGHEFYLSYKYLHDKKYSEAIDVLKEIPDPSVYMYGFNVKEDVIYFCKNDYDKVIEVHTEKELLRDDDLVCLSLWLLEDYQNSKKMYKRLIQKFPYFANRKIMMHKFPFNLKPELSEVFDELIKANEDLIDSLGINKNPKLPY